VSEPDYGGVPPYGSSPGYASRSGGPYGDWHDPPYGSPPTYGERIDRPYGDNPYSSPPPVESLLTVGGSTWIGSAEKEMADAGEFVSHGIAALSVVIWLAVTLGRDRGRIADDPQQLMAVLLSHTTGLAIAVGVVVAVYCLLIVWKLYWKKQFRKPLRPSVASPPVTAAREGAPEGDDREEPQGVLRSMPERRHEGATEIRQLWLATQEKIDQYHVVAQQQARTSFRNAQLAITGGFIVLAVSVAVAAITGSTAASIATGVLGVSGGALAAYVSSTFIRAQENTSTRLQGYFTEPAEISRMLVARLLLSEVTDDAAREQAIADVARNIASSAHPDSKTAPST
jgi:ABC-type Co2+ transport system permease subunit